MTPSPLILYIEDDGLLMNMYQDLFTLGGFRFEGARDFASGRELIGKEKPDVILLDLILPPQAKWIITELSPQLGLDLLSEIKTQPETKDLPVIILSNLDEPEVMAEAKKRGADEYLIKVKVQPKDVLAKVRDLLSKKGVGLSIEKSAQVN